MVDKVWKDTTDSVPISRGWMSHYQIMAATLEMNGDNAYLHNKGGLDFGVRVSYHANEENTGVNRIDEPASDESPAEIIANDRVKQGLKYKIPSILELKHGYLTDEEKDFFREELNIETMDDDLIEYWHSQFDRDIVLAEEEAERERLSEEKERQKLLSKQQQKAEKAQARALVQEEKKLERALVQEEKKLAREEKALAKREEALAKREEALAKRAEAKGKKQNNRKKFIKRSWPNKKGIK